MLLGCKDNLFVYFSHNLLLLMVLVATFYIMTFFDLYRILPAIKSYLWWSGGSQNCWCDPASPLVPRRLTIGGGTPLLRYKLSPPCLPVGRAVCTLLCGLLSMLNLTVIKTKLIVWKSFTLSQVT